MKKIAGLLGLLTVLVFLPAMAEKESAAPAEEKKIETAEDSSGKASKGLLNENLPGDVTYGKPDAKVRIVEYASLSCSHCRDFHRDMFPSLKSDYIDTGKVYFVYRHFPLNTPALRAAMLVGCLPDEEQKRSLVNALFGAQGDWAYVSDAKSLDEKLQKIVALMNMDEKKYQECISNKTEETALLERVVRASKELQVKSTPTVFVNGTLFPKTRDLQELKKTIDAELEK